MDQESSQDFLRNSQEKASKAARLIIENFSEVGKIYLYGSVAKGTATPDSDIDLCCVVKLGRDKSLATVRNLTSGLQERAVELLQSNGIEATSSEAKGNAGKIQVYILLEENRSVDGIGQQLHEGGLLQKKGNLQKLLQNLPAFFRRR